MQEEGIDLKNCLFVCSRWSWREGKLARVSASGHQWKKAKQYLSTWHYGCRFYTVTGGAHGGSSEPIQDLMGGCREI